MTEEGEKMPETKFELVGEEEEAKNWKGMVLSVIVILAVFGMVITAIILNREDPIDSNKTKLTLDDLTKNFDPKRFNGSWINNNEFVYIAEDMNIRLFNCEKLNSSIILSNHTIVPMVGDNFEIVMSSNQDILIFMYDRESVNRHSFLARYKIYNLANNMVFDVMSLKSYESVPLQNLQLSPDGQKVAFVDKNNIYLMERFIKGEKTVIQITNDGKENTIYNGITDWLYEEEIMHASNSMYWSPNSRYLAYIKFNDSLVEKFSIPVYNEELESHLYSIRYPKVNSLNPTVQVLVYDTEKDLTITQNLSNSVKIGFKEYYIWNIQFLSDVELITVYVDREQKKSITIITDILTGAVNMEKEYPSKTSLTWNLPKDLIISKDYYFQIWYIDNFANILAFNSKNGNVKQVTMHNFDVMDILHVNEKSEDIFYIATNGDPKQRHLFRKKISDLNGNSECLTCSDSKLVPKVFIEPSKNQSQFDSSDKCLYHSASFSQNGDYYALECLGDRIPITFIKSTINESVNFIYEENFKLKELIDSKILPNKSYVTVMLDEETGETADAEIYYPITFDPAETETMYPVLVYAYGSPSSQLVDYQFNVKKFEAYMTTNFDTIVAIMDGRGTIGNGAKFMKSVYKQLGKLEMQDQFALAGVLQEEIYTNDSKFAFWGWSYGGYLSALMLLNESTPFSCGISGAPVTDWRLYDTAYTERYLGLLDNNRKAYHDSSLLEFAKKNAGFYGKRSMLLVHGTADDNVHFQNSAVLANLLRRTNLELEFEVFPYERHTPSKENQVILFKKLTRFLLNCYNIDYKDHLEALNLDHLIVVPPPPPPA